MRPMRVAIITGGGRGLGRTSAMAIAKKGFAVAVASRTKEELDETVDTISDAGGKAMSFKADISDPGDVTNLVKAVELKFGQAEILVNNAAIVGPVKELKDVGVDEFDYCMGVNLKGMFLMARAVIPGMIRKRHGSIVNITSGLSEMVMARLGAHSISKAGVNHFTRILARELEPHGIRVNALDPGVMDTRMQKYLRSLGIIEAGPEIYRTFRELKNSGLLKDPSEAAKLVAYLATDESAGITGQVGTSDDFARLGYPAAA